MPMGGTLIIKSRAQEDKIIIEISDSGIGIPEANLKNIFEILWSLTIKRVGI